MSDYYTCGKGHFGGEQKGGFKPVMNPVRDKCEPSDDLQKALWDAHILVEVEDYEEDFSTGERKATVFGREPHLSVAVEFCALQNPPIEVVTLTEGIRQ
jgi:hypothetical protein